MQLKKGGQNLRKKASLYFVMFSNIHFIFSLSRLSIQRSRSDNQKLPFQTAL